MSKTIDERVVEMQFDNKNFESNVATSMSTLEKLKKSLNLSGAAKGLDSVSSAASKVNLSGLSNGIETVHAKFSALQIVGVTALANIANSAINAGKRMASAFTVAPIMDGFREYETQMNAVQTILANTQKEGTNVAIVNKYLDELNTYADKTIYNFTEMTRNIGTFTAAGVKLDASVSAIKGIANLAAVSGSSSQQASTAMYQLSQAIASGTVRLMDWNSVVNAGMGGQVFQDALTRTSEHLQTGAKAAIAAQGSFRESLSTGWLTVDVLTQTLDQFSTAADTQEEYEAAVKKFIEQGYTQEEAKQIADMAKTAGEAATKVKTFTQLIDTLKEAAGSGWTKTWQIIIGDFEEARTLWSSVSDVLSDAINNFSDARNKFLESALGKGFSSLSEKFSSIVEPAKNAIDTVQKVGSSITDLGAVVDDVIIGKFGNGQERFDKLTEAGYNWCKVQNQVNKQLGCSTRYTEEQIAAQDELLGIQNEAVQSTSDVKSETKKLTAAQKQQLKELAKLSDEQLRSKGYTEEQVEAFKELRKTAEKLGVPLDEFIDKLDEINGRWLLVNSFKNIGTAISKVFSSIGKAFNEVFGSINPDVLFDAVGGFHKLTASMIPSADTCEKLTRTFKGLFSIIDLVSTIFGSVFKVAFAVASAVLENVGLTVLDFTAIVGDMITDFNNWFKDNIFAKFVEKIAEKIPPVIDAIQDFIGSLNIGEGAADSFKTICEGVGAAIDIVYGRISASLNTGLKILGSVFSIFGTNMAEVLVKVSEFIIGLRDWISTNTIFIGSINKIAEIISTVIESVAKLTAQFLALKPVQDFLNGFKDAIRGFFDSLNFDFDGGFLDGILSGITSITEQISKWLSTLADSEHFGEDLVAGLVNGIQAGIGMVIDAVTNLATSIIETVCGILGIHSPSVVMFEIGENIIQGLTNGISAALSTLWSVISGIGTGIIDFFKNLDLKSLTSNVKEGVSGFVSTVVSIISGVAQGIADALNFIDWGVVATTIISTGVFVILYKFINVLDKFAGVLHTIFSPIKALTGLINSISKYVDAKTLTVKADAVKSFAIAIGILAASIWVLSTIDATAAWNAVGIIAALSLVITGMTIAIDKFGSKSGNTFKDILNLSSIALLLVSLGASLLLFAASCKLLSTIDEGDVEKVKGFLIAIGGIMAVIVAVAALSRGSTAAIASIGGTILAMGVVIGLLAIICRSFASMNPDAIDNGIQAIARLAILMGSLVAIISIVGGNAAEIASIGGTILAIGVTIGLLAAVCRLLGDMNPDAIDNGMQAIARLAILLGSLVAIISVVGGNAAEIASIGGTLLAIGVAIGLLAVVCRMLSGMDPAAFDKGMECIARLSILVIGLVAITSIAGGNDLKGVAATLLAMSASIAILAGVCVVLGMVKEETLLKGIKAVTALSVLVAGMVAITSVAKDVKGTFIGIAVAIGVMAGAIAVLSMIEPDKLWTAVGAMSILMVMFALIENQSKNVTNSFGTLIVMTVAIGMIAGALTLLSTIPAEQALGSAIALSAVLLAMSVSMKTLSTIGEISKSVMGSMAMLLIVVVGIATILGVMSALDVAPSIETAASLSLMLIAMSIAVGILGTIGPMATAAIEGAGALVAVAGILTAAVMAFGAISQIPGADWLVSEGGEFLEKIGTAIGQFVGGIAGGFVEGATSTLPEVADSLSDFMTRLTPFIEGAKTIDESTIQAVESLSTMILKLTAADLISSLTSFISGGSSLSDFADQLVPFGYAIAEYSQAVSGIDAEAIQASAQAGQALAELASSLPKEGGLAQAIFGENQDMASFGTQLVAFGTAIKEYSVAIAGIDAEAISASAQAGQALSDLAGSLPKEGGLAQAIFGENQDLSTFGTQLVTFGTAIKEYAASVTGLDVEAITTSVQAGKALTELANALPDDPGWIQTIFGGQDDLSGFGDKLASFGAALGKYSNSIVDLDIDKMTLSISAAKQVKNLAESLQDFDPSGIDNFKIGDLGQKLKDYADKITEVDFGIVTASIISIRQLISMIGNMVGLDTSGIDKFKLAVEELATVDLSGIAEKFSGAVPQFTAIGSSLIDALLNGMRSQAGSVSGVMSELMNSLMSGLESARGHCQAIGSSIMNALGSGIMSSAGSVYASLTGVISAMIGRVQSCSSMFSAAGLILMMQFKMGLTVGGAGAVSSLTTVLDNCVNSLNGYYGSFYSAGSYVASGFAAGIRAGAWQAKLAATAMANAAEQAARDALDINSPSKVFRKIGSGVPEGFIQGIDRMSTAVYQATRAMGETAVDGMSNALSKTQSLASYVPDEITPTISPVVDMSNVEAGVSAISSMFSDDVLVGTNMNLNAISASMRRRNQNGANTEILSAINKLHNDLSNIEQPSYYINGITYDDGSAVASAVETLVRAAVIERRM